MKQEQIAKQRAKLNTQAKASRAKVKALDEELVPLESAGMPPDLLSLRVAQLHLIQMCCDCCCAACQWVQLLLLRKTTLPPHSSVERNRFSSPVETLP